MKAMRTRRATSRMASLASTSEDVRYLNVVLVDAPHCATPREGAVSGTREPSVLIAEVLARQCIASHHSSDWDVTFLGQF